MSQLNLPQLEEKLVQFLRDTYAQQKIGTGVIAVSGGIDSAVALCLLTKALGKNNVHTLLLPYKEQNMHDAELTCEYVGISAENQHILPITTAVNTLATQLKIPATDKLRLGNLMARTRMLIVYDYAKKLSALVCGTENKSEHYLGYFTRHGDAASDIEPISTLYKTEVRQLAAHLQLPTIILQKAPSAGLWADQTDEQELGFTYADADQVIAKSLGEISTTNVDPETEERVLRRIRNQTYKLQVPYVLPE